MKSLALIPSNFLRPALFLILAIYLAPVPLRAEPLELSVDEAVERALQSNLDVFGQGQTVASALRNFENRWNLFLPGISAGLNLRRSDKLVADFPLSQVAGGDDLFSTTLNLGTRVSFATGLLFDLHKRTVDYRSALLSERETIAKVSKDVEKAYFALVSLGLDLENKEKGIVLAEERLRMASIRFDRGLGSELDMLRAQMSVQTAKSTFEKARSDNAKQLAAFRRQLGLDPGTQLLFSTAINLMTFEPQNDLLSLINGRADLERARLAMAVAESEVRRFIATIRMPVLTLEAEWILRTTDANPSRDSYTLGAGLTFNADAWIPNSRRDLELRSLRDTQERLAFKYEQDRRNASELVDRLVMEIAQATNSVSLAEAQVRLSERIHEGTSTAYERGLATAFQLETDEAAVDTARQSLIASRYQYLALLIDLGYELDTDWRTLFR